MGQRKNVASKNLGVLVAYISKKFGETYTYDLDEAMEFSSQDEVNGYVRERAGMFLPGWKYTPGVEA